MKRIAVMFIVLSMLCGLAVGFAQDKSRDAAQNPAGFRGDFLKDVSDVQKKITDLAGAMPQEKYSWRPMEGVRSVSEVFNHIAGSNYFLPTMVGAKAPEGYSSDEGKKLTDKAKVVENLKESFDYLKGLMMKTTDADLDKPTKWFGEDVTVRFVYFQIATHLHEHLGQSIAYARSNNVVPPWTAAQEAAQKNSKK